MHNAIRLFVAAPLPEMLKQQLIAGSNAFKLPGVRFVPEENLHLTLFFIGNTSSERIPEIQAALKEIAATAGPFELKLSVIEPGPKPRHPRLIWARFGESPAFAALSRHITKALAVNQEPPLKPVPHVTLARLKKGMAIPDLPVIEPGEDIRLQVNEIALWQSKLGQPHPAYSIMSRFLLTCSEISGTTNHP